MFHRNPTNGYDREKRLLFQALPSKPTQQPNYEQLQQMVETQNQTILNLQQAIQRQSQALHQLNQMLQAHQSVSVQPAVPPVYAEPDVPPVTIFGTSSIPRSYIQNLPQRYRYTPAPVPVPQPLPVQRQSIPQPAVESRYRDGQERIRYNRTDGLYREKFNASTQSWEKTETIRTVESVRNEGIKRAQEREAQFRMEKQRYEDALRMKPIRTGSVEAEVKRRMRAASQLTGTPMQDLHYSNPYNSIPRSQYIDEIPSRSKPSPTSYVSYGQDAQTAANATPVDEAPDSAVSTAGDDWLDSGLSSDATDPDVDMRNNPQLKEAMRFFDTYLNTAVSRAGIEWKSRRNIIDVSRLLTVVTSALQNYLPESDARRFAGLYAKFVSSFVKSKRKGMTQQEGMDYATAQLFSDENDARDYKRLRNQILTQIAQANDTAA